MSNIVVIAQYAAANFIPVGPATWDARGNLVLKEGQAVYDTANDKTYIVKHGVLIDLAEVDIPARESWHLFLDDERSPESVDWSGKTVEIARSSGEAIALLDSKGLPGFISFDHDLGGDDTGMKVMWHLIYGDMDGKWDISDIQQVQLHTANVVGRKNLEGLWVSYCKRKGIDRVPSVVTAREDA